MASSILQNSTKERIRDILRGFEIYENYRPNWLRNDATGRNLELDFYIPEVQIGIEVQGAQHFQYTPGFHASEEDFIRQQQRDQLKQELCSLRDVDLYEVIDQTDIDKFINTVTTKYQKFGAVLHEKNTALKSIEFYKAEYLREMRKPAAQRQQSKLDRISARAIRIVQKYNLDPAKINADFQLRKRELQYSGMKKVLLYKTKYGGKPKEGVLIGKNERAVKVRCIMGEEKEIERDYYFDIATGEQITDGYKSYKLIIDSLTSKEIW